MMWLRREVCDVEKGTLDYGARELVTEFNEEIGSRADELVTEWIYTFGSEDATTVLPLTLLADHGYSTVVDGIDWMKVVPKWVLKAGHGTVIVLTGQKGTEHTLKGDESRDEGASKYGLAAYLNTRFYTLPKNVNLVATCLGAEEKGNSWGDPRGWPKDPKSNGISNRHIDGMKECLEGYVRMASVAGKVGHAAVTITDGVPVPVVVETYLFPDLGSTKETISWDGLQKGHVPSVPIITNTRQCHEGLDLIETYDARTMAQAKESLHRWINIETIRRRLVIVNHPQETEDVRVFPDQSRRTLLYTNKTQGGTPLPETAWADAYKRAKPAFMTDAVSSYFAETAESSPEIDQSIIEKLKQYTEFMAITAHERRRRVRPGRDPELKPAGGGRGYTGSGNGNPKPTPGGKDNSTVVKTRYGLIEVRIAPPETNGPFPIEFNTDQEGKPMGIINMNHTLIQDAWGMCRARLVADSVDEESSEMDVYMHAFRDQVIAHVALALTHCYAYIKAGNPGLKDQLLSPSALTLIACGIRHFHQASQGPFGTIKAGRLKRKQ
jgi:hypothetical protein